MLTAGALLGRLGDRLKLLKTGARDLPVRQQTLRGAIAWSHDLLTKAERKLFRRLAVFSNGCTLEAVETICTTAGDNTTFDVLDGVTSLVDKSLVRQIETASDSRYLMLESIHEYSAERLVESGEEDNLRIAHAEFFNAMANQADLQGHGQLAGLARLE